MRPNMNNTMPPIIRLKHYDKHHPVESRKIVELAYGKFNVPFTRIFNTNEGYKVICRNENDADKIQSKEAKQELEKIGLQLIIPPETKARKSIILRRLDQIIGTHTAEEIKEEIEKENEWIKIEEVIKIKNYTHILKIRMEEISMVEKAKQQGILAYNMAISPSQIEQEIYIQILTCYKCYQMEDHQTKDCPYPDLKICSECSVSGHTYKDCKSQEKACINCKRNGSESDHRTLAMTCPLRKAIINDKINENKNSAVNKAEHTYAEIARRAVAEVKHTETPTVINLSEQKHTKILISIMHAHVMNLCNPGTYQTELNKMLVKNELPTMWFPANPDSGKLLGATMTQPVIMEKESYDTSTNEEEPLIDRETERTPTLYNRDPRLEPKNRQPENECTPTGTNYPHYAEEIGLRIHLTGKTIVPTMDPHIEFVIDQIKQGSYKWTYTNTRYDEDTVKQLMATKRIKITKHDFKKIDEGSYRKIRNGLCIRSPPQENRKPKRHSQTT